MTRYRMLIDSDRCMNCGACVVACQQRNMVPYGCFRNWIRTDASARHNQGKGFQPGGCMQCDHPLCVDACPSGATWKAEDGVVLVDPARCIGCGSCIAACPYDARHRDPVRGVADKCDYCAPSRHLGIEPACVQLCPTRARMFGDMDDPASPVARTLKARPAVYVESPRTPTKPTLAYIGATTVTDWPREARIPAPVAAMGVVASGIRYLGGLSLFGVIVVLLKQLVLPSDTDDPGHAGPHDAGPESAGPRAAVSHDAATDAATDATSSANGDGKGDAS